MNWLFESDSKVLVKHIIWIIKKPSLQIIESFHLSHSSVNATQLSRKWHNQWHFKWRRVKHVLKRKQHSPSPRRHVCGMSTSSFVIPPTHLQPRDQQGNTNLTDVFLKQKSWATVTWRPVAEDSLFIVRSNTTMWSWAWIYNSRRPTKHSRFSLSLFVCSSDTQLHEERQKLWASPWRAAPPLTTHSHVHSSHLTV